MIAPQNDTQRLVLASGAPYSTLRARATMEYPIAMQAFRKAFDSRKRYSAIAMHDHVTFQEAGVGLDRDGKFVRFVLSQYGTIEAFYIVTLQEVRTMLRDAAMRDRAWVKSILARIKLVLRKGPRNGGR